MCPTCRRRRRSATTERGPERPADRGVLRHGERGPGRRPDPDPGANRRTDPGANRPVDASLPALVAEVMVELHEARSLSTEGVITWTRGGREFASLGPSGLEIRLEPAIASAATRTPETAPSQRGPEWVRFSPRDLDQHALDRLRAWLQLAYRRAGE